MDAMERPFPGLSRNDSSDDPSGRFEVRTLLVTFRHGGDVFPVSAFRGAVVEKVGREYALFHNHEEDGSSVYRYPLIQYKFVGRQPAVFCAGDGVDEIHRLFLIPRWKLDIQGRSVQLQVDRLDLRTSGVRLSPRPFAYRLQGWMGLNESNRRVFHSLGSRLQRREMMERILTANILAFAKGIGWHVPGGIYVSLDSPPIQRTATFKGRPVNVFDLDFHCNVALPEGLGLGKAVSLGFGVLQPIQNPFS
jgi:hypothetical protein